MLSAYVAVFLTGVVAIHSLGGNRCCTPKQWEGKFCELGSYKFGRRVVGYADYSSLSVDQSTEQVAVDMHYVARHHKGEVKFIIDFHKKKMYVIYGSKCKVRAFPYPFAPLCISDKAKNIGSTYLGAGSDKLDVTTYYIVKKSVHAMTTVTKECIPVSETVSAKVKRLGIFKDISFFGFTAGIKNPKVFVPPKSCGKEEVFEEEAGETLNVHSEVEKEVEDMIQYVKHRFTL